MTDLTADPAATAYGMTSDFALGMIRARCIMRGIDATDYQGLEASISSWDGWSPAWTALGERYTDIAVDNEEKGRSASAGELHLRAAVAFHFGKALALGPDETYRDLTERSVTSAQKGYAQLDPSFERIVVPVEGGALHANLRRPPHVERPPLVLMIPGTESTKDEFSFWEPTFLSRGMATLSVDGPGQGETGLELSVRPDYEAAVTPLLDALEGRDDLDLTRVGATGISLGGYYVMRAAAFEPRLKAVVGNCGCWNLGEAWESGELGALYRSKFTWVFGAEDEAEAIEIARTITLEGVAEQVDAPALVIFGGADALLKPELHGRHTAETLPHGELWMFEGGNHGVTNRAVEHIGPSADWLLQKLNDAA